MTLQEYFNQTEPEPNLSVILKEDEYIRISSISDKGYVYSLIKIPKVEERYKQYNLSGLYIQVNDRQRLYTINKETGKPNKLSVFYLPEDEVDLPLVIKNYRDFSNENVEYIKTWGKNNPNTAESLQERNERFENDYNSFLLQAKEKYSLTDEDIDFWKIK